MLLRLTICLASAVPVLAQSSTGPFLACPLHLTVGGNTLGPGAATLTPNLFYSKPAGFYDLGAASPHSPARPNFTFDAMFGASRPPNFQIDAISSGYCKVFCQYDLAGDPVLRMTPGAWGALLFSVTRSTPGDPDAAVVAVESARPDGPGADLYSLVLPGSSLPTSLDCVPIGVAQRASDSGEMGFRTAPGQRPEMLDFDPFFSFYAAEGPVMPNLVPDPWVYFSVPGPVASLLPTWFSTRGGVPLPAPGNTPSGATILRIQWRSTASPPHWSQPQVFLTFQELGLLPNDDIDALSVDESGLVLLSLRRTAVRTSVGEQLMVASFATSGGSVTPIAPARVYYFDDGTDTKQPMGKIAGAGGGGDIDATCEIDPSNTNGTPAIAFGYVVGCRADVPFPVTMSASAFAALPVAAGVSSYAINLSSVPSGGLAALMVGFPGPGGGPVIQGVTLGLFLPTTTRLTHHWSMPVSYTARGWDLDYQWAALHGPTITLASTVRLRL